MQRHRQYIDAPVCTLVIKQSPRDAALFILVKAEFNGIDVYIQAICDVTYP